VVSRDSLRPLRKGGEKEGRPRKLKRGDECFAPIIGLPNEGKKDHPLGGSLLTREPQGEYKKERKASAFDPTGQGGKKEKRFMLDSSYERKETKNGDDLNCRWWTRGEEEAPRDLTLNTRKEETTPTCAVWYQRGEKALSAIIRPTKK